MEIPFRQKVLAIITSVALLVFIIELVRRKKLREEYSWLWILTGIVIFVLGLWFDLLLSITYFIGAGNPPSTLFFLGLIFLILINIHYSVKISELTNQVKNLAQELAILSSCLEDLLLLHTEAEEQTESQRD